MRRPRGGTGGPYHPPPPPRPLKNHKNIGFLSILVQSPEKSQSYQASIQSWECWAIIDWGADGGTLSKEKKMLSELDPLWQTFLDPGMVIGKKELIRVEMIQKYI